MAADEAQKEARATALMAVLAVGFGMVALSLISLQVFQQGYYSDLALENRQYRTRVLAPRGIIRDRTGVALADNVYQARVTIARHRAKEGDPALEALIELLELDRELLARRLERSQEPDRVTIVRHADPTQIARVEENRALLPDVQLLVEPRRRYRNQSMASHLLGYVGEVRAGDLEEGSALPYKAGDVIGRGGVEAVAEAQLRGKHGLKVVEVNAAGHIVGDLSALLQRPVIPGVELFLTISQPLQEKVEEVLEGWSGAALVMEVATGDLLAAASAPTFDPNEFTGGISAERWSVLNDDPRHPLFNRVLQGTYPPASPYKVVTAAAALERGRISEHTRLKPCYGGYRLGRRLFRCWKLDGHGVLDLTGALAQSCDVYFYQVAEMLSIDELAETARQFGLGRATGLDIPGEHAGLVPTSAWYDQRYGPKGWTRGVLLNNSIGQGELLVTPLQMVRAYAAIAGDGYLYRPHLTLAREHPGGLVDRRQIRRSAEQVCSPWVRSILRNALSEVVDDRLGTGSAARVEGVSVSGKTGTAENPHGEDHAWFLAYAPSEDAEIAVALIVENSGHGGEVAAPLVQQILEVYFSWKKTAAAPVSPDASDLKGQS